MALSNGSAYGQALEDLFQAFIVSITGLEGSLVRPRWQPEPPPMPSITENWCAFGIKTITPDDGPYFDTDASIRHEKIELFLSFYGEQGQNISHQFRDAIALPKNLSQLKSEQIKLIEISAITTAPDFINQQYVHRYDVVVTFRRKTTRQF